MARTLQQNAQARETRMEQIRSEALRQFALKGLVATRIQDIAQGVGMAQGLLYHYYPAKESIYIDLVKNALDKTIEASLAIQAMDASTREKIDIALDEVVWLITLLANQSVLVYNLQNPEEKRELLTEEAVELLTSPLELATYKESIMDAMLKGAKREIESEDNPCGGNNSKNAVVARRAPPG